MRILNGDGLGRRHSAVSAECAIDAVGYLASKRDSLPPDSVTAEDKRIVLRTGAAEDQTFEFAPDAAGGKPRVGEIMQVMGVGG